MHARPQIVAVRTAPICTFTTSSVAACDEVGIVTRSCAAFPGRLRAEEVMLTITA